MLEQAARHPMAIQSKTLLIASWAVAFAGPIYAPLSNAASFPCEKAQAAIEKLICGTPEVSELDEYLGRYYAAARTSFRHAESCLVNDQRAWLRTVRDACKDAACLKRAYLERLAVLHAVQPGATSLRNIELPKSPPLVWIVPPAADQVAAPRNQPTVPLSASGKVVNDISTGDGYILQSNTGEKILIVPLMFLEQPTSDALESLARLPNSAYMIRGHTDSKGTAAKAFASSQCAFVYRTSP